MNTWHLISNVEGIRDYNLIFRDDENSNGVYMDPIAEVYDECLLESHPLNSTDFL